MIIVLIATCKEGSHLFFLCTYGTCIKHHFSFIHICMKLSCCFAGGLALAAWQERPCVYVMCSIHDYTFKCQSRAAENAALLWGSGRLLCRMVGCEQWGTGATWIWQLWGSMRADQCVLGGCDSLPHSPRFLTGVRDSCWQKLEWWQSWGQHLLSSLSPTALGREVEGVSNAYTINLLPLYLDRAQSWQQKEKVQL